jgi:hypothetical protein
MERVIQKSVFKKQTRMDNNLLCSDNLHLTLFMGYNEFLFRFFFFVSILWCSHIGCDHAQEDLAKFGYRQTEEGRTI